MQLGMHSLANCLSPLKSIMYVKPTLPPPESYTPSLIPPPTPRPKPHPPPSPPFPTSHNSPPSPAPHPPSFSPRTFLRNRGGSGCAARSRGRAGGCVLLGRWWHAGRCSAGRGLLRVERSGAGGCALGKGERRDGEGWRGLLWRGRGWLGRGSVGGYVSGSV